MVSGLDTIPSIIGMFCTFNHVDTLFTSMNIRPLPIDLCSNQPLRIPESGKRSLHQRQISVQTPAMHAKKAAAKILIHSTCPCPGSAVLDQPNS
jgi:hypothetical protein